MGYTVGLYFPRLAVVSWNPLALVGRTWQFCGKPPRNQASTVWLRQLSRSIFQIQCIERFVGLWPSYEMNNSRQHMDCYLGPQRVFPALIESFLQGISTFITGS